MLHGNPVLRRELPQHRDRERVHIALMRQSLRDAMREPAHLYSVVMPLHVTAKRDSIIRVHAIRSYKCGADCLCVLFSRTSLFITIMSSANRDTPSILCVEPDTRARELLQEIFAPQRVVLACNSYEALRELYRDTWDGYVLECWLPDLSGLTLCREIRKIDPRGPVLFSTSAARIEDRARAFRAGASEYLCKPIDAPLLAGKLRALLELAAQESACARPELDRALEEEFTRRIDELWNRTGADIERARRAMERICRPKAAAAFTKAGGTRAYLHRYWNVAFTAAWETYSRPGRPEPVLSIQQPVTHAAPSQEIETTAHV
jgi:CheY-like chemotaxis protein